MEESVRHFLLWALAHPHWAGIVTFVIAAAESVAVIGTIIPGSVMMTAIGILIGASILPIGATMCYAIAGAVAGDGMSYYLGYFFKDHIRQVWPFKKRQHLLDKGIGFFKHHGGKSVFIGRFIGPIRALVPLVAGILRMHKSQFFFANLTSAILWAPLYMLPGMVLGAASLAMPADIARHYMWFILFALIVILIVSWIIHLTLKYFIATMQVSLNFIWSKMQRTPGLSMLCDAFKHYREDHPRGQLGIVFCLAFLFILFISLMMNVVFHGPLTALNEPLFHFFRSIHHPKLENITLFFTFLGQKEILLPAVFTGFIWLVYQKCWRAGVHWLSLGVLTAGSVYALKFFIHSPRPPGLFHQQLTHSFPSGHTTLATALYGFAAYMVATRWPIKSRLYCYLTAIILVLLVATSRLYLGAHWLTDVIGGICLGLIWILAVVISYQRQPSQRIRPVGFLLTLLFTIAITGSLYVYTEMDKIRLDITRVWPMRQISLQHWWVVSDDLQSPLFRTNRIGQPEQILNVQIADTKSNLMKNIKAAGWDVPREHNWVKDLQHPVKVEGIPIHIRTTLFKDRRPALVYVNRYDNGHIMILRLWDSDLYFDTPHHLKLWVGVISTNACQVSSRKSAEKSCPAPTADQLEPFIQDMSPYYEIQLKPLPEQLNVERKLEWQGNIIAMKTKKPLIRKGEMHHDHLARIARILS
ncbi:MAG: bifunctional DedA family/phosphatase PAP2 family protein [Gammaproteobacteria bacterium]